LLSSANPLFHGLAMAQKAEKRPSKDASAAAKKKPATDKKSPVAKKVAAPKKVAEKKVGEKKAPVKRKSRSAKVVRMKAFWGVFNQSLKRVALFDFNERKEADKKAKDLTASGKSPHFVQPVREPVVLE
jgi:hypothetical protein